MPCRQARGEGALWLGAGRCILGTWTCGLDEVEVGSTA